LSIINRDRDRVEKSRQNKLEDVEVSLRDQIPKKLKKKLEDLKMGKKVVEIWENGNSERTEWLERQALYLADWDEFLVSSAEGPFQQSSSLHVPMPLIVVKSFHARFLQALLGVDPAFNVKARTEASIERASLVQDTMRYTLSEWCNNYRGIDKVADEWLWDWITTGVGLLKIRWDTIYTKVIDIETEAVPGPPEFIVGSDGNEISIPTVVQEEKEVSRTKKVFEGPVFERVPPEDLLFIGGKGDPQEADAVIQQNLLTASELWTLVDRKIFDEDVVKEIISKGGDSIHASQPDNIKQRRILNEGRSDLERETELDRYRILEAYLKVDVDGSGINSDVVIWVHERSKLICRATFLHRINKAGLNPYYKIDFLLRPGQTYGAGLVEMLKPLSTEMDAMHNMRIDFGLLSTMPFGFYKPTSSMDAQTIQLEPGMLMPLDNPQTDIVFPNMGNRTSFGFQEEAALQTMIERLTGISDLALGVLSGVQGATRTATGTRALQGELSANLDVFLRRLNRGWKQTLEGLLNMLQQRIPKGLSFRVTGESGSDYWAQVGTPEEIAGDFDLELSPNTATSNKNIQLQNANTILQLISNPLDIQLGIVTPQERYEAIKNVLKQLDIKDFAKFIRQPPQTISKLSPEEEVNRILRGIEVPITPEMDHEGFIAFVEKIKASDELLGQYSPEQTVILEQQSRQHAQMLEALQELSQQQRVASQMQNNAATAAQQAPAADPIAVGQGGTDNG